MTFAKKHIFIAGCLLNIAGIWLALTLQVRHDEEQTRRAAETTVSNLARAFEEYVLRTAQEVDGLLLQLREDYRQDPRSLHRSLAFHKKVLPSEYIMQVSIADARGILKYSDHNFPSAPVDLSDREHFRIHRDTWQDRLFISKPVLGRVSDKWSIQFTRRLTGRDGSFAGVIIISVAPEYFSDFFRTIDVGTKGAIVLLGTDGVVRARACGVSSHMEPNGFAIPPTQPLLDAAQPPTGIYHGRSVLDDVPRIMAYRRLKDFPLIVNVAAADEDVFRAAVIRRNIMAATGILVSVALLGGLALILWLEKQQLHLTQKLTEREEQLRKTMAELERLATTDALTELPNRRSFFTRGVIEFSRSQRYARPLAAMMIDIDHFKGVNDRYGHAVGDAILQHMAWMMRNCLREADIIARYGGEEFAVLLPETGEEGAYANAERLRSTVEANPLHLPGGEAVPVTISIGIATMEEGSPLLVLDKLLQQADEALYLAKRRGRNRVETPPAGKEVDSLPHDAGDGLNGHDSLGITCPS